MLNLHHNHIVCLRQLPKLPAVEHLCVSENAISSLGGLGALRTGPLRSLNLARNPVTFTQDYRVRWEDLPKGIMCVKGQDKRWESFPSCLALVAVFAGFSPVCQSSRSWMGSPSCQKTLCPQDQIFKNQPGCAAFCDTNSHRSCLLKLLPSCWQRRRWGKPTDKNCQLLLKTLYRPRWKHCHGHFEGNVLQGHEEGFLYRTVNQSDFIGIFLYLGICIIK